MRVFDEVRMDKKTERGYLYIKANNTYINGVVGTDIKLTLKQKIDILFSKGISVVLQGKDVTSWCNVKSDVRRGCKYLDEATLRCSNDGVCLGKMDHPCVESHIRDRYWKR